MMTTAFVERLTVRTWIGSVCPRLLWRRLRGQRAQRCYTFDASPAGMVVARACRWLTGAGVEPLRFRLAEVRDEQGLLIRLRISYRDLAEVQAEILADPVFRGAIGHCEPGDRFPEYLTKALAVNDTRTHQLLWRALLTIQVCAWHLRQLESRRGERGAVYFMERRVWFGAIRRYAFRFGVTVVAVPATISLGVWLRSHMVTPQVKRALYHLQVRGLLGGIRIPMEQRSTPTGAPGRSFHETSTRPLVPSVRRRPRMVVEYYGSLNVDHPEQHSDLFFWQPSQISAQDVVMTFNLESHPLDAAKLAQLNAHGIGAVAVRPRVAATSRARVFVPRLRADQHDGVVLPKLPRSREGRWLLEQARRYYGEDRAFWEELFQAEAVKVFVSWFRYTEIYCAIADALARVGGVTAIYQRAYESFPSPETAVSADVFFVYSPMMADVERRSGSRVSYVVSTGYLGDCRFARLRAQASRVRRDLQRHGAQRVVGFADENSLDDERWHTGHRVEQESYAFLLERVLAEPWLGVVIKPKVPATLRRRLGPVAELLQRAERTGRCVIFATGSVQGAYPPAAAALASDVMIHGHLNAGSAGVEAALAGVPTLLLDRFGWPISPLYRLGVGRVVFTDWQALWRACLEQWNHPRGIPGFGDWSPMLDELDPFRDGRAAERMGTYLRWLLEGFRGGLDRQTVMADAAERYAAQWGRDKIAHANCASEAYVVEPAWTPPEVARLAAGEGMRAR